MFAFFMSLILHMSAARPIYIEGGLLYDSRLMKKITIFGVDKNG